MEQINEKGKIKNGLSIEDYIKVKKYAYKFISYLTEKNKVCGLGIRQEEFESFINGVCPYERGSAEYDIFINTIYVPNDIGFMQVAINANDRTNVILNELGLPTYMIGIISSKLIEMKAYRLDKIIQSGKIDQAMASLENPILYQEELKVIDTRPENKGKTMLKNLTEKK